MALSTANTTQASARALRCYFLLDLGLPSGTLYISGLDRAITVGGRTYTPNLVLLALGGLSEHIDGKARRISLTLSGLDATLRANTLGSRIAAGTLVVRLALADAADASFTPVDTPVPISTAILSNASLKYDDGSGTLEISAETSQILLRRDAKQLATDAGQQQRFAGDTGLKNVAAVALKKLNWNGGSAVAGSVFALTRGSSRAPGALRSEA